MLCGCCALLLLLRAAVRRAIPALQLLELINNRTVTMKSFPSNSLLLFGVLSTVPLISAVNWFVRYESLQPTCPTANPALSEVDGYRLNTCLNYGGNGYTSKYFCDMGKSSVSFQCRSRVTSLLSY